MYQNQALLEACCCYYYYYSVLGSVSVGERGREDGQRVREDEHAADDDADAADEAPVVVSGDVTVAGLRHGDDGEVQRQDVALAGRQHRRVGALGQPARPVAAAVPSIRAQHQQHTNAISTPTPSTDSRSIGPDAAAVASRKNGKGRPYSITERRVPGLIPVLGSQPAGDVSHKPGGRLPLLSARPAVTPATLKRAATSFAVW